MKGICRELFDFSGAGRPRKALQPQISAVFSCQNTKFPCDRNREFVTIEQGNLSRVTGKLAAGAGVAITQRISRDG